MVDQLINMGPALWRSIGDAALLTDGRRVSGANPALAAMLGCAESDLLGLELVELFEVTAESDTAEFATGLADLVGSAFAGRRGSAAFLLKFRGGLALPVQLSLERIDESTLLGLVRLEVASVEESDLQHLRSAGFESSPICLDIVDEDGRTIDANQAHAEMWGYDSRAQIFGSPPADHFVDPAMSAAMLERVDGTRARTFEFRARRRDGSEFDVRKTLFQTRDRDGRRLFIGSSRDISIRRGHEVGERAQEERLAEAQRMESVGRIAAGIAHDFNNMLSPILVYSELLLEEAELTVDQVDQLSVMRSAADRCRTLTKRLLAFSRKQVLDLKAADLGHIVKGLGPLLERTVREDVRLQIDLPEQDVVVLADASQVEQIVTNLVINAQDAMPAGGDLQVQITQRTLTEADLAGRPDALPGTFGVITVSDSGVGMDAELQRRVFEPFFTTKGESGTGLGLATVYGIAKQHGGNVWLYSEPGKGSTFRVYLPLTDQPPVEVESPTEEGGRGRGELVLVAEDNELIRGVARTILVRQGYRVLVASTGAEALELLEGSESPVDLLLTDVVMPDMNGRELADAVRRRSTDTQVIFMSGYTDNVIARHGMLEPEISLLEKPFTERELAARIRRALD